MKKTNVKPPKFYKEAEGLQPGWGAYLKNIDQLKDAVANQLPITIKEYCFTLYGDCYTDHCSKHFKAYYQKHFGTKKLSHQNFSFIFKGWVADIYDSHSN
jgi:hypothetical protein